jgi:glycosyltransferase involved in cell wall biosynthesis
MNSQRSRDAEAMDRVDVVVLTKNSATTIEHVLNGILNAIPVNKLIVVDGESKDETLNISRRFGAKIVKGNWNLAFARYQGVLEVETEWFCFVDSDIYIFPSWYRQIIRWKKLPRIAWIQGLTLEHSSILGSYARSKTLRYMKYGCVALSNSLLNRDIVLKCADWRRRDVHAGEDTSLFEFVKLEGNRILVDASAICLHLPDCFFHDIYTSYRAGYSDWLRQKHIPIVHLGVPAILLKEATLRFFLTKDPRLLMYFPAILGTSYVLGYFGPRSSAVKGLMEEIDRISKTVKIDKSLVDRVEKQFGHFSFAIEM